MGGSRNEPLEETSYSISHDNKRLLILTTRSSYKYDRFNKIESEIKKIQKMSNQAVVEKLIAERNWYGLFDALDADKNGTLSHQEFWKWENIGSSNELRDALNKFDVSSDFLSL